jgi:cysteinyl-tRNA synthetase
MHTGFLNVEGQKMSKSLGNFIVLDELLSELEAAGTDPAALRFYFAQTHYRSKIDFSRKGLDEAATAVERLERTRCRLAEVAATGRIGCADVDPAIQEAADRLRREFATAMDDDIHTPGAIAALWTFQRAANAALESPPESPLGADAAQTTLAAFEECGQVLTLFDKPVPAADGVPAEVSAMVEAREAARAAKDWATSDRIRDELQALGYRVMDTPDGTRVEKG